jgi:hypothetical protein
LTRAGSTATVPPVSDQQPAPADAPKPAVDDSQFDGSPYAQLRAWRSDRVPREEWLPRLKDAGVDEESARVLINSFEGANPSALPDASFSPGTNPLAPSSFALDDFGLHGDPATVGLYWMAFGGTIALMVGVFALLVYADVVEEAPVALLVLSRVMGTLAAGAFCWGAVKAIGSVRVRRR